MTEQQENRALEEYGSLRANQLRELEEEYVHELPMTKHVHRYRRMLKSERTDRLIFVCSRYICDGCGDQYNM